MTKEDLLKSLESEMDELSESVKSIVEEEVKKGYASAVNNLADSSRWTGEEDELIMEGIIIILTELALLS